MYLQKFEDKKCCVSIRFKIKKNFAKNLFKIYEKILSKICEKYLIKILKKKMSCLFSLYLHAKFIQGTDLIYWQWQSLRTREVYQRIWILIFNTKLFFHFKHKSHFVQFFQYLIEGWIYICTYNKVMILSYSKKNVHLKNHWV